MDKVQKDLAKVIENYFGADAGYLDIDCFTLARRIMEAGWTKPVRCKDCRHYKRLDDGEGKEWGTCGRINVPCTYPNNYCSYGERRNDGSEAQIG